MTIINTVKRCKSHQKKDLKKDLDISKLKLLTEWERKIRKRETREREKMRNRESECNAGFEPESVVPLFKWECTYFNITT